MSWWPLQSTFLKSTLWIGYWTQQCEDWYQMHKQQLADGTAQPLNITDWKGRLRLSHDPPRIFDAVESAAVNYFDQKYSA
jgi:hypothetical protein